MKPKHEWKWLLLMLIPIGIIPLAMLPKAEQTASMSIGAFPSEAQGEPRALIALSDFMKRNPSDRITINYLTPEDEKTRNSPRKDDNFCRTWGFDLIYNRRDKTLTKTLYTELPIGESDPTQTWIWQNVEENAIHQVAAPVQKFLESSRTLAVENYRGVKFDDLQKYGATLAPSVE